MRLHGRSARDLVSYKMGSLGRCLYAAREFKSGAGQPFDLDACMRQACSWIPCENTCSQLRAP